MSDAFERFGLVVNDRVVKTPIAIASMAGIVDAEYVAARAEHIGMAFIGGYSIDGPTMKTTESLAASGERKEFLYDDPVAELARQAEMFASMPVVAGINLRGSSPESFGEIAEALGDSVIYEIDAHCRQKEMIDAGAGEYYLRNPDQLAASVRALKKHGVTVSVKIRAGVSADDRVLAKTISAAGADIIHVDLMDFGTARLRQLRNSSPAMVIANNSIYSYDRMREMFSHGADIVSIARRSDAMTLAGLDAAISRYADEEGWYNSPKQLCRGGDIRALTFCCMPVKECPLIPTLSQIGMKKDEYIRLKTESVKETPLDQGSQTCFGSLCWCCKTSSPCMFRDLTLRNAGLTRKEYMQHKRQLSDTLLGAIFNDKCKSHDETG
jgi:TIM-barrel protein